MIFTKSTRIVRRLLVILAVLLTGSFACHATSEMVGQ